MAEPAAFDQEQRRLRTRIRVWLAVFIAGMALSGLTAFPLQTELEVLTRWLGVPDGARPEAYAG